ncbi:MAG: HigA family addiction module antitoxin [Beijerinckiaceae bacterium]|jgi:addiction module HigA family antidote|nr:HigA family addiction module antitoxin [Beijerinckiaceae bacterium]
MTLLKPVHPGEVLREEFLQPMALSAGSVARALGVPRTRIERLAAEQVDLSPDNALRLARYFGTSAEFWLNLHMRYVIETTGDAIKAELDRIEPVDAV